MFYVQKPLNHNCSASIVRFTSCADINVPILGIGLLVLNNNKLVVVDVGLPTAGSRSAGRGTSASVVDSRGVGTSFRFSVCSQNHNN